MSSNILITGTSGMLGKDVYSVFSKISKYNVYGVDLIKNTNIPTRQQWIGDLTNQVFVNKILEDVQPEIIIHCAAIVNLETCQNNKRLAIALHVNVTRWFAEFNPNVTKFIYISTDSVFNGKMGGYKETDKTDPVNFYSESKLEGEKRVKLNPNHIIIRTNIFGFNLPLRNSLCEWAIKNLKANNKIQGFTNIVFNGIYTKHLGEILTTLIDIKYKGVINVASKNSVSKYEFISLLGHHMGFPDKLIIKGLSTDMEFIIPRPLLTNLDVTKIQNIISIPSVQDGIENLVEDYNRMISKSNYEDS